MRKYLNWNSKYTILLLALFGIFLLRLPSLFEPYWYGDEGITLAVGQAIRAGRLIYTEIHDNKPPLLYLLSALIGNLFWLKFMLMAWMMITTVFFWKLSSLVFEKNLSLTNLSTFVFALLTTLPKLEGNTVNGELFMIGFIIPGVYLVYEQLKKNRISAWRMILGGILFGLGFLFKHPAGADFVVMIILCAMVLFKKNSKSMHKSALAIWWTSMGFIFPLALMLLLFWNLGNLNDYFISVWIGNWGYVSLWSPIPWWGSVNIFGGRLYERLIILIVLNAGLFWWYIRKLELSPLFLGAWFCGSLFGALLSSRPYPHYLLQVTPSLSLLIAGLIVYFFKKNTPNALQLFKVAIFSLTILVISLWRFGFWNYRTIGYYTNFLNYFFSITTQAQYFSWFDPKIEQTYSLSAWIVANTSEHEEIFIWGEEALVYALSDRRPVYKYVAEHHIEDFGAKEITAEVIKFQKPNYIIFPSTYTNSFEELNKILETDYELKENILQAEIYKRIGI